MMGFWFSIVAFYGNVINSIELLNSNGKLITTVELKGPSALDRNYVTTLKLISKTGPFLVVQK